MAVAGENPFSMQVLSQGYMVADAGMKAAEGKCGAGKDTIKDAEGKCGAGKETAMAAEGKQTAKGAEGKCGEGKCGAGRKGAMKEGGE